MLPGLPATPAGALVWWNGRFHRVADPFRHFGDGVASVPNPVGTPLDKALVGLFRLKSLLKSPAQIFAAPETSTLARLQACMPPAALLPFLKCTECDARASRRPLHRCCVMSSVLFVMC
jgi:hypothetical protein